jgi:hypothetical protein
MKTGTTQVEPGNVAAPGPALDPIRQGIETRDLAVMVSQMTDDVVLHSPVARFSFRGRELVSTMLASMLQESERWAGEWRVDEVLCRGPETYVIAFGGRIAGRVVDMVNVMRLDEENRIREMTVYARPMAAVAVFPAHVFPLIVARHRGKLRAMLIRIGTGPLPLLLEVGVTAALRLGMPRGASLDH